MVHKRLPAATVIDASQRRSRQRMSDSGGDRFSIGSESIARREISAKARNTLISFSSRVVNFCLFVVLRCVSLVTVLFRRAWPFSQRHSSVRLAPTWQTGNCCGQRRTYRISRLAASANERRRARIASSPTAGRLTDFSTLHTLLM
jgi:hypothetical protein